MIVYKGHPTFDFVFESRTRDASFGQFVGTYSWCSAPVVLWENSKPGGIGPLLDSLTPVESTGLGIDGEGVFHGTPRKSVAEITADADDVFGAYPKNLKKLCKIVPIESNLLARCTFEGELREIIRRASDRMSQAFGKSHWVSVDCEIRSLIDRYFKEVP